MAEIAVTNRRYFSHGQLKGEIGDFINVAATDNFIRTMHDKVLFFELIPLSTTAPVATSDNSCSQRLNRVNELDTPQDSPGRVAWDGTELTTDGTFSYVAYGW